MPGCGCLFFEACFRPVSRVCSPAVWCRTCLPALPLPPAGSRTDLATAATSCSLCPAGERVLCTSPIKFASSSFGQPSFWPASCAPCALCIAAPLSQLAACIPVHLQAPSPMCLVEMATTLPAPPAEVRLPRMQVIIQRFYSGGYHSGFWCVGAQRQLLTVLHLRCPAAGYYQPNEGAVSCLKCPAGQITANMSTGQAHCTSW